MTMEFVNPATPINLNWTSAQLDAPYLLEKSIDGGATFSTVVADLFAQSYQYQIPAPELGLTVRFRVTAQRGAIAGPTAGVIPIPMFIVVGATAFTSATFGPTPSPVAALAWSAATRATSYLLEKSTNGGATFTTVATVAGLTYNYNVPGAEINTTVKFRVTGMNGATAGPASAVQDLAMTVVVGAMGAIAVAWNAYGAPFLYCGNMTATWAAVSNATAYRVEQKIGAGGFVVVGTTGGLAYSVQGGVPWANANQNFTFRVTPLYAIVAPNVAGAPADSAATPATYVSAHTVTSAVCTPRGGGDPSFDTVVTWTGPADRTMYGTLGQVWSYGSPPGWVSGQSQNTGDLRGKVVSVRLGDADTLPSLPVVVV